MTVSWPWLTRCATLCMMAIIASPFIGTVGAATVEIVEHTEGGLVSGFWKLEVTVSGTALGVRMSVDGGNASNLERDLDGLYSTVLSTRALPDGAHEVVVEAYDSSGGTDRATISLEIDNTPPEMTVQWPDDVVLKYPFKVDVTFSDAHPVGSSAWVEVNGTNRTFPLAKVPGGFAGTIDIQALANGTMMYTVVVQDGAGNRARSNAKALNVLRLPDLALARYDFGWKEYQNAPDTYRVRITVSNRGFSIIDGFDVALYANDELRSISRINASLGHNESWSGFLELRIEEEGQYNLSVVLDPANEIAELNESNNGWKDTQSFSSDIIDFLPASMVFMALLGSAIVIGFHRSSKRTHGHRE